LSVYQGIVWKDVLFANAVVAGFIALAHLSGHWRNPKVRYALLTAAFLLLTLAALSRQNGIILLLVGATAVVWIARRNGAGTMHAWFWGGSALLGAVVALVCANVGLATRVTGDLGLAKQFWASFFFISNRVRLSLFVCGRSQRAGRIALFGARSRRAAVNGTRARRGPE
jgi:hypothetical protein